MRTFIPNWILYPFKQGEIEEIRVRFNARHARRADNLHPHIRYHDKNFWMHSWYLVYLCRIRESLQSNSDARFEPIYFSVNYCANRTIFCALLPPSRLLSTQSNGSQKLKQIYYKRVALKWAIDYSAIRESALFQWGFKIFASGTKKWNTTFSLKETIWLAVAFCLKAMRHNFAKIAGYPEMIHSKFWGIIFCKITDKNGL